MRPDPVGSAEPDSAAAREETSARLTFAFQGESVDGTLKLERNNFDVKHGVLRVVDGVLTDARR